MLGLPFLRIGGESALRFDVPTLRLHFFGTSLWMDELFVVLAATVFLAFLFLAATLLFGRVWCGWGCPQTALLDLTALVARWRRRGGWRGAAALGLALAGSALVGANLLWYFVTPGEFFRRLWAGGLGPVLGGSWVVLAAASFGNLAFLRQRFCATVCPYARLQGALFDRHTLLVAYDARRAADCIDCGACVRVCPTGIDIRRGLQMACIACAECVDACEPIMRKLGRAPRLVGYFFGDPGTPRRLLRPAALALGAATAVSLAAAVAVGAGRSALDLDVSPAASYAPRLAADGRAVNAYAVSLENRARGPLTVRLVLSAGGAEADMQPREVQLSPGEHRRLTVLAMARGPATAGPVPAVISAQADGGRGGREARAVPFVIPDPRR